MLRRRRSQSTTTTLEPDMAMDRPRQKVVTVLPSPGRDEVTRITCTGVSTLEKRLEARRLRNASAKADSGLSMMYCAGGTPGDLPCVVLSKDGTAPRWGMPSTCSTSSEVARP